MKQLIKYYDELKKDDNFTLHTFGFGADHDGKLMNDLAELKDGDFCLIDDISMIDEAFANVLGGLISTVAKDIKLSVNVVNKAPFSDTKIEKAYGDYWNKIGITY